MPSFNACFLMGNLTRDPEVRYTASGSQVTAFGLAVSRKFTTQAGVKDEEVSFFDIETWGRQAETCAEYLKKGSCVFVDGRLRQDRWKNASDGKSREKIRVRATRVQFIKLGTRNNPHPQDEQSDRGDGGPPF